MLLKFSTGLNCYCIARYGYYGKTFCSIKYQAVRPWTYLKLMRREKQGKAHITHLHSYILTKAI